MELTLEALDREWADVSTSAQALRTLARWGADEPALAAPSFDALLRNRWDAAVAPLILRALAERAAGDRLAARTLLQALVPGLGAMARDFGRRGHDVSAELISLAWERIRTYPLQRPGSVAGNVLLDVRKAYLADRVADRRAVGMLGRVDGIAPSAEDEVVERHAHAEVVRELAAARHRGVVNEVALRAFVRTRLEGDSLEEVAADEHLTVRNLVLRRWRGERALRRHLDGLARAG